MRVILLIFSMLLFTSVSLSAQENEAKETFTYSNITEFGFSTTSPQGVAFEATTVHGFSIDKKHHFGIGFGVGGAGNRAFGGLYTPIFMNYRYYFEPKKSFSPQVNALFGGLITEFGGGMYSAVTAGFLSGKFSFSSGVSLMFVYGDLATGIVLKCGFAF